MVNDLVSEVSSNVVEVDFQFEGYTPSIAPDETEIEFKDRTGADFELNPKVRLLGMKRLASTPPNVNEAGAPFKLFHVLAIF